MPGQKFTTEIRNAQARTFWLLQPEVQGSKARDVLYCRLTCVNSCWGYESCLNQFGFSLSAHLSFFNMYLIYLAFIESVVINKDLSQHWN